MKRERDVYKDIYKLKESEDVQGLVDLLVSGQSKKIVQKALDALLDLVNLGIFKNLGEETRKKVKKQLLDIIKDPEDHAYYYAILFLGMLKDNSVFDLLLAILKSNDVDASISAVYALCELGDYRAFGPLLRIYEEADEEFQEATRESILFFHTTKTPKTEDLLAILENENEDPDIRISAAMSLGNQGDVRAIEPLLDLLNHKHRLVREFALLKLDRINSPKAKEAVIKALDDEDMQGLALEILTSWPPNDIKKIEPIITRIGENSDDEHCRELAEKVLETLELGILMEKNMSSDD